MPDKQRAGVYGTAKQIVAFPTNRRALRWVTPDGSGGVARREFSPREFVRGTLYSLSEEGVGTVGALVAALTVAVCKAAEDLAARSAGGRLPVPMVAVLDEAANVCRWRELPNLYSHYGSRGIVLMTILQSWSQGVDVWGREGMRKLWSAANVKVYGGGVHEREFLSELSELIGDVELTQTSTPTAAAAAPPATPPAGSGTRRRRPRRPAQGRRGRAGLRCRPTLARTLPWMDGPQAEAVKASIRANDPAAAKTIAEAMD